MNGLILVPTPIQEDHPLETVAKELLLADCMKEDVLVLVPREAIEKFILFNEHSQEKIQNDIIKELKNNKKVYLLSDCGLPAFCDPGQLLVDACHRQKIKVTATPYPNSISLAVALSGFSHSRFIFSGFVPVKEPERTDWMKKEFKSPETLIWMETPYRLKKLLEEMGKLALDREIFLGCDLGGKDEALFRGSVQSVLKSVGEQDKREFVLVIATRK
jgi:16S rRNA (cytidine1402-2'-O)-methyltransferase